MANSIPLKINLYSIDRNQFAVREFAFHGESLFLVNPKNPFEVDWNKDNLIFRSSIWNQSGELVSAGFKKFGNWLEKPDLFPPPQDLTNSSLIEKIDGSLLCLSNYKCNLIVRTRGSYDATEKENGHEIELLKQKYPKVFNYLQPYSDSSLLLEWVSPINKIVCDYSEPDLYLIGAVVHHDYSLLSQEILDKLAAILQVKRPTRYNFGSISEMLAAIKAVEGKEGVCLYTPDGNIFKIKSDWYLKLFSFKNHINLNSIIDLFCDWGYPSEAEFISRLTTETDYECVKLAEPLIKQVAEGWLNVKAVIGVNEVLVDSVRDLARKDAAVILKNSEYPGLCFQLLDGKANPKTYKDLLIKLCKEA